MDQHGCNRLSPLPGLPLPSFCNGQISSGTSERADLVQQVLLGSVASGLSLLSSLVSFNTIPAPGTTDRKEARYQTVVQSNSRSFFKTLTYIKMLLIS